MLMWICLPLWCVFSISHGDFSLLYNVKKALLLHSEAACQTFLFSAHGIHSTSASSHHVGFVKCTLHVQSRWPLTPDYFLSQSQNFLEKSMKTVPEFPSVFYSGSLGRPPSFLLVLCLFFLELCKWEQSVAWRYFGSFALPRLCTCRWRTAIFVSLSSSLGPFLCLLQISHLPIQGHTRHSPCCHKPRDAPWLQISHQFAVWPWRSWSTFLDHLGKGTYFWKRLVNWELWNHRS